MEAERHGTSKGQWKGEMMKQMELDDALMILTEIATGADERQAICLVKESVYGLQNEAAANARVAETYRHLYEDAQKRMMRLRERAAC